MQNNTSNFVHCLTFIFYLLITFVHIFYFCDYFLLITFFIQYFPFIFLPFYSSSPSPSPFLFLQLLMVLGFIQGCQSCFIVSKGALQFPRNFTIVWKENLWVFNGFYRSLEKKLIFVSSSSFSFLNVFLLFLFCQDKSQLSSWCKSQDILSTNAIVAANLNMCHITKIHYKHVLFNFSF